VTSGREPAPEVLIVGGGLGGLTTGALLARSRRVLLLEREPRVGGRARCDGKEGFLLSDATHGLLHARHSPLHAILTRPGREIPVVEARVEQIWRWTGGRRHPLPASPAALLRSQLVPLGTKMQLLGLHTAAMAAKPSELWDVPWIDWLRAHSRDPHAHRLALDNARGLHFTTAPEGLSAGHALETIQNLAAAGLPPSLLPVGGWATLHTALRAEIEAAGGRIETGVAVERVELTGAGSPLQVHAGSDRWEAQAVVIALPPQQIAALLPESTPLGDRMERWTALAPTAGVSVDLGGDGVNPERAAAIDLPEEGIVLGCPTLWDPSLAPDGAHLLKALRFVSPEQAADPSIVAATRDLLLERLEEQYPGATRRPRLLRCRAHPVLTAVHHVVGQSRPHLPPVAPPETPGLYFVSDGSAAPGELANVAASAALIAAERIEKGATA
jgi:phytoene dehydrogenase-like protein